VSKKSIYCIATSRDQADHIVDCLKTTKFSNKDISVLFRGTTHDFAAVRNTKAPDGAVADARTGDVLGEALRWIDGIGALAIEGDGAFIAAGPIIAAWSEAAVGATTGGIADGLIGLGIPELEARRYESKVKAGHILISVHSDNWGEIPQAREIFTRAWAQDIRTAGGATTPEQRPSTERGPRALEIAAAEPRR
jgi:hypothetical protein